MDRLTFTQKTILILKMIPKGKVTSYGAIATLAGSPRAARRVVQIIHRTKDIPWHRVVNGQGKIAIKEYDGFQEQRMLLAIEGVETNNHGKLDLPMYQWEIHSIEEILK